MVWSVFYISVSESVLCFTLRMDRQWKWNNERGVCEFSVSLVWTVFIRWLGGRTLVMEGEGLSVRSCRAQQMLFVALHSIVVESWDWEAGIGCRSGDDRLLLALPGCQPAPSPATGPPLLLRGSWCKVSATLLGRSKLCSGRERLRKEDWREREERERGEKETDRKHEAVPHFSGFVSLILRNLNLRRKLCAPASFSEWLTAGFQPVREAFFTAALRL